MTKNESIQRCLGAEAKAASLAGYLNKLALDWQLKESELVDVKQELTDHKNKYATMAGEVDCRTLDMVRWKERALQAERALSIATTDKEMALREMRETREHLATEVGPGMWHLHEVDRATLAERIRCTEIANIRGLNQDCGPFPELYAYGRRIADAIAKAIMEEPK